MQGLIGKKIGMTQIFNKESGKITPITVIKTGANVVCQLKNAGKDGYSAIQLGFETVPEKKMTKALIGHFKKNNSTPLRVLKEFKPDSADEKLAPGQTIGVEIFDNVVSVDVIGISKGRGFAGGLKRWNFSRGRETHGCKAHRIRGSSGANTTPGRVVPGLRMEGHMGAAQVTIRNLKLAGVDKEMGLVFVKGAIPGPNKGIVFVKKNILKK
jgi:large subunit ribosomal protein L3